MKRDKEPRPKKRKRDKSHKSHKKKKSQKERRKPSRREDGRASSSSRSSSESREEPHAGGSNLAEQQRKLYGYALPKASSTFDAAAAFDALYPAVPRRHLVSNGTSGIVGAPLPTAEEIRRRKDRASRFAPSLADQAMEQQRSSLAPLTNGKGLPCKKLRGTALALEKSYTRLTTMWKPEDVRPLKVLRQAFELVEQKWAAERDYTYVREQLKAIRQDLTVQQYTVAGGNAQAFVQKVYQTHARIALVEGDLDEFGQCQSQVSNPLPIHCNSPFPQPQPSTFSHTIRRALPCLWCILQLIQLHAATPPVLETAAEFCAYRLLHCAALRTSAVAGELYGIISSVSQEAQAHSAVAQARLIAVA